MQWKDPCGHRSGSGDDGVPKVNSEEPPGPVRTDVLRGLPRYFRHFLGDNVRALVQTIQESIREKDILVWLAERDHQDMIVQEGWSGGIISEPGADYLAVVSSDMSDDTAAVREDVWKETSIAANGDIGGYGRGAIYSSRK